MGEMRFWLPIGLFNLAHYLKEYGIEAKVYNADATSDYSVEKTLTYSEKYYLSDMVNSENNPLWADILAEISEAVHDVQPDAVGISIKSDTVRSALRVISYIKSIVPGIKIFAGGAHFSAYNDNIFSSVADAIVVGEAENIIVDIVKNLGMASSNKLVFQSKFDYDVNAYFDLDFSLITDSQKNGLSKITKLMIASSRGCPFTCAFCFKSIESNNKVRFVEGKTVGNFIKKFYESHGIKKYYFVDDTFGINEKQLNEFVSSLGCIVNSIQWSCMSHARILTDEKVKLLKLSGCNAIHLGVESGSQRILNMLNKNILVEDIIRCADLLHSYEIDLRAFIIIGIPTETDDDLECTKELIERICPSEVAAQVYIPYNGTRLYNTLTKDGSIDSIDWLTFVKSSIDYGKVIKGKNKNKSIQRFFSFVDNWNAVHMGNKVRIL
jgi:radical SAM superfamily enzyme YgiQ (UPF0313 family)